MLFLFVVFFTLADVAEAADNSIKPDQTNVFSMEGSNISLSCTYTGSVNSLHWYRQKPGSRPEFLLLTDETGHAVWFRDSVTEEETGVRARSSRAEDVEVLFGSDKVGQD
ncbi:hypothetical protein QTP70_016773 [Hemibagrus guttatus]|uniref:Ig-like domain-containing protein n=1 Tax=Hemibagrus guttatus TaxID=175788 RepID=A0AAE0R7Q6_9TELE|nr:hypothetical protein QTP70_016773 [Hemibagrus guttatus]